MSNLPPVFAVLLACCLAIACRGDALAEQPENTSDDDRQRVVSFVRTYCVDCHDGDEAESGLDLGSFSSTDHVASSIESWKRIAGRVHESQMPPQGSEMPSQDERAEFVRWIRETIHQIVCDDGISPGGPMIRRLNRTEYANTVRDLLGIQIDAGHALPSEGAGGEGFDNAAETLFISPILAEKYLEASRAALQHALKDPRSRERLITAEPNEDRSPDQAAEKVLGDFLPRAFRRSVSTEEIDEYLELFRSVYAEDQSFLQSIQFAMQAAMVSPKFLFLVERVDESASPVDSMVPVRHEEMASRLSYFLWATMPDAELLELAAAKKLQDEAVLREQVARMLHSRVNRRGLRGGAKVREFAASFMEQWLGTRALGREFKPDPSVAPRYDSELEGGMKYEPIFFFEDLLSENRSLLNLIDSDFTYVNRRLARHYRVRGEFREQPKLVELPEDSHRGGVLGMSAVLAVSSLPHRTSPVLRGKWVLENILGTPAPPPPPDVPPLDEDGDAATAGSLRERLELHRANAVCASCHSMIDPLGFGLENYDVLGSWRTVDSGVAIDASGQLPSGESFDGPEELKQQLMDRKDQFVRHFTAKMLGYALARGLSEEDGCVVEEIAAKVAEDDYKTQTLITEIVLSVPFRYHQYSVPSETDTDGDSER